MQVEITAKALVQAEELNEPIYSRVLLLVERLKNWPAVSGAKPCGTGSSGTIV